MTQDQNPKTPSDVFLDEDYRNIGEILIQYLQRIWMIRRKIVIINAFVLLTASILVFIFQKPYYESTIVILPDYGGKSSMMGGLGGLAAMAGVSLGESASPSDIYKNLLTSESIITPVLAARYKTNKYKDSVNIYEYFDIQPDNDLSADINQRKMFLEAFEIFKKSVIDVSVISMTKILTLKVRMPESKLSADVANNLIKTLDVYVRTKRKSNASIQRAYIERRISEVNDSLTVASNNLKNFQFTNRAITQSPNLLMEQTQLNLKVQILQGVYSELVRQLEIAKIDEIRDAPMLDVREWASEPIEKAGPNSLLTLLGILCLSVFLTVLYFLSFNKVLSIVQRITNSKSE
jgi:uncharacterized protein involved in exopolysaccharide biosynthesis